MRIFSRKTLNNQVPAEWPGRDLRTVAERSASRWGASPGLARFNGSLGGGYSRFTRRVSMRYAIAPIALLTLLSMPASADDSTVRLSACPP
jgi:hypothetical protein